MLLHEIIKHLEGLQDAVLIENMANYKKSLLTYFAESFTSEPILLVVSVCNAAQYALICPADEISEALDSYDSTLTFEDKETIFFNSMPLSKF